MTLQLTAHDDLTMDLLEAGVVSWDDLVRSVKSFHFGRNNNRSDFKLVWYERKGSCSSKHAFLKTVADLNQLKKVELVLAFYKMNAQNTKGISKVLHKYDLNYIPEAYCYLKVNGTALDVTTIQSNFEDYRGDIISTQIIQPNDVIEKKVNWHRSFLSEWLIANQLQMNLDEIWKIREACISELEKQ